MKNVLPAIPQKEWVRFSKELLSVSTINKSRVGPKQLSEVYEKDHAVVIVDKASQQIVAFAALWETQSDAWFEMGTIYVTDKAKGCGYAHTLFHSLLEMSKQLKKSVFLISVEPKIHSLANGADWICPSNWKDAPCAGAIDPNRPMDGNRRLYYFHLPTP